MHLWRQSVDLDLIIHSFATSCMNTATSCAVYQQGQTAQAPQPYYYGYVFSHEGIWTESDAVEPRMQTTTPGVDLTLLECAKECSEYFLDCRAFEHSANGAAPNCKLWYVSRLDGVHPRYELDPADNMVAEMASPGGWKSYIRCKPGGCFSDQLTERPALAATHIPKTDIWRCWLLPARACVYPITPCP